MTRLLGAALVVAGCVSLGLCAVAWLDGRVRDLGELAAGLDALQRELGWKPRYTFEEGLRETVRWYLEHEAWTTEIVSGEYQQYYAAMYGLEQETT